MSGFVVACGEPRLEDLERMFEKIGHRGPYISGIWNKKRVMMAQNYLRADIGGHHVQLGQVPVGNAGDGNLRICYDGQIGKRPQSGLQGGPFEEERLLLHLYERHGSSMVQYLDDAVLAFVISNGEEIFAARDLLGIKTLFCGWKDNTLYLASELKSLVEVTDDIHEFPPGHCMSEKGRLMRYAELPKTPPVPHEGDAYSLASKVKDIVIRSFTNRVNLDVPTGSLLSGGIDSSVIAAVATRFADERFHGKAPLKTFAIGVGG